MDRLLGVGLLINCNKITKPEFTKQFILENCGTIESPLCKHASAQIKFCQLFGPITEHGKIIVPDKKIKYPSMVAMGKNFLKASAKHIASGFKTRSDAEQKKCMAICKVCPAFVPKSKIGPRCKLCGCCEKIATRWATKHCPASPPKW